jgi:hypothetical protein
MMMDGAMHGGGAFWGMGVTWILIILLLGLGIAALIKYLRK